MDGEYRKGANGEGGKAIDREGGPTSRDPR